MRRATLHGKNCNDALELCRRYGIPPPGGPVRLRHFCILALAILIPSCAPVPPQNGGIAGDLAKRYPRKDARKAGDLVFNPHIPIVPLRPPALATLRPDLLFFLTKLETGHPEYQEVEAIIVKSSWYPT